MGDGGGLVAVGGTLVGVGGELVAVGSNKPSSVGVGVGGVETIDDAPGMVELIGVIGIISLQAATRPLPKSKAKQVLTNFCRFISLSLTLD